MTPPELVIISGFTAAGKTTHARLLADELGWRYVGMSQLRRRLIPASATPMEEWCAEGDRIREADTGLDRRMDRAMAEIIAMADSPLVVDAWLQPWLCSVPHAIRIWLTSSFESRVIKADVTRIRSGHQHGNRDTEFSILKKDRFSIEHFKQLYSIRFFPDPAVFDIIIDNSPFITESSIEASDKGIAAFHPIFSGCVRSHLSECARVR